MSTLMARKVHTETSCTAIANKGQLVPHTSVSTSTSGQGAAVAGALGKGAAGAALLPGRYDGEGTGAG